MPGVDPDRDAFRQFMTGAQQGEFVMLNLLRYKPDGGRERYAEYIAAGQPFFEKTGGEVLYFGETDVAMVAPEGEGWDAVLLVRYPSRESFAGMIRDPGYQAITHLRTEALDAAVLQPTTPFARG